MLLVIEIDASGKPVNVKVEKSEPAGVFDQAATQWQFNPTLKDGKPVAGRVQVPIEFAPRKPKPLPAI